MRKRFGTWKTFVMRSLSYAAIINGAMLLFLTLSQLEVYGFDINITKHFFPLLFFGILMLGVFGYVEDRLGLHEAERKATEQRNPYMKEIVNRLERIENKLTIKK